MEGDKEQDQELLATAEAQAETSVRNEVEEEVAQGMDGCSKLLVALTYLIVVLTFPLSLMFTIKIVKEYERAVIMRMGRMVSGGAQGPGLFFCTTMYRRGYHS